MRLLVFGDIHDCVDRVKCLFEVASEITSNIDLALITGDFGEKDETLEEVSKILQTNGLMGVAIYGNHEPESIRRLSKEKSVCLIEGIRLLPLGVRYNIDNINILGISGNRGSGRKWSHWRDSQILEIIERHRGEKIDIVLSHEMPHGLADTCRGKNCGQFVLRRLIEELNPRIFLGGHLHTYPQLAIHGRTVVLKVGGISNRGPLKNLSFFAVIDISIGLKIVSYMLNIEKKELDIVLKHE